MKNEKHPLDEFFKEGLSEHKIQPSASVWDKIEEAQPEPSRKKGAWFILRAAVVTLLIGLSTLFYFQNNDVETNNNVVSSPDIIEVEGPDKNNAAQKQNKATEGNKDKTETPKEEVKPKKKAVPIMRQSTSRPVYVSNDEVLQVIDEDALYAEDMKVADADISLQLKAERKAAATPIKVKVRLKPRAATEGFYANADEAEEETPRPSFKNRMQTYASSQMDNVLSGKPLEWPKVEKKQIEIPLPRILSN
ncbi:hypothetical protein [Owenweeksia hongkongensis]|uniref:hypothetical protein n=1 Tax=Owenweeksia hongkongensis TaxID=253245 RepID=UPI003A91D1D5